MKKKITLAGGILALILLLSGASILYNRMSEANLPVENTKPAETQASQEDETEPMMAPDFIVLDREGAEVSLSDFIGKPVILNFWASWCGPCKSEMPEFEAAYQKYREEIQFMMVNLTDGSRETVETAAEYIAGEGYTFPVFFDTESDAAISYGATSIPVTYFVDAEGHLVAYGSGALSGEILQSGMEMILPPAE